MSILGEIFGDHPKQEYPYLLRDPHSPDGVILIQDAMQAATISAQPVHEGPDAWAMIQKYGEPKG